MEHRGLRAGSGVLLLAGLGAVSQLLGFGYRVALSRLAGAEVMGLYQLVMPVYGVMMAATAVGLTAAMSNLTPQYLAQRNSRGAEQLRRTCLRAFFLLLLLIGAGVVLLSDFLSTAVLGDARTQLGLVLLVPCVALTGVENLHKHAFYGAGQVVAPAVTELLEQIIRTGAVLGLLAMFLPQYPERAVGLIVAGMIVCEVFSAVTVPMLYRRRVKNVTGAGEERKILRRRVAAVAVPVAANALLGNLLGAANSALVPRKLVEGGMARGDAVAKLGVVCGMTLPMLALPTVFLGPLSLVLVPRLARARALNHPGEVRRLVDRAVGAVAVLALPATGWMMVFGADLGRLLFRQEVGEFLCPLGAVMAMSCFCSVLGSALNGVGRQRAVALISLLGGVLQLVFTLLLVPPMGMAGYVAGAVVSTGVELALCLWAVEEGAKVKTDWFAWFLAPGLAATLSALTARLLLRYLTDSGLGLGWILGCCVPFGVVLYVTALAAQGISIFDRLSLRRATKKRP